ncbi:MAG TPA: ATP-binding protein, partial [Dissulfurispiraceae bacterium]|nr:ATP-binding protein [Dissulfurispiraceae bacterium]
SRPADARKETVDVGRILGELPARIVTEKSITIGRCDTIVIQANRTFLEVAILNIVKNAVEAAQSTVSLSLVDQEQELILVVEDDGPGISDELRDRIFEPFFTTKESGTGLGLAISYRIITSLGGAVTIEKSPLGGAKFVVRIPIR